MKAKRKWDLTRSTIRYAVFRMGTVPDEMQVVNINGIELEIDVIGDQIIRNPRLLENRTVTKRQAQCELLSYCKSFPHHMRRVIILSARKRRLSNVGFKLP